MKEAALFVAFAGLCFIASTIQPFGVNWLGQSCYPGPCFYPQWLALGLTLLVIAYVMWRRR
jgi:hypothetical protein